MIKNVLLVLLVVTTVAALIFGIRSYRFNEKSRDIIDHERYERMVAERDYQDALGKIRKIEVALLEAETEVKTTKNILDKQRQFNDDLQSQLQSARKDAVKLNKQLSEALSAMEVSERAVP